MIKTTEPEIWCQPGLLKLEALRYHGLSPRKSPNVAIAQNVVARQPLMKTKLKDVRVITNQPTHTLKSCVALEACQDN